MSEETIRNALKLAAGTEKFILSENALDNLPAVVKEIFSSSTVLPVADNNTWYAAGRKAVESLRRAGVRAAEPLVFPGHPTLHADYAHVEKVRDRLAAEGDAAPLAIGSGTINDIVKRAAFEADLRYAVVATAASVDGYTSNNASITRDGFKKSMEARPPAAVIADIDILREAPRPMTAAGYGDLASKLTAGADWIIADALGIDPIDDVTWKMVQEPLGKMLSGPEKLFAGDPDAFRRLFEGLAITGFAMQHLGRSRAASGADHLFSHVWEMEGLEALHGFTVAIGTLLTTAVYELLFSGDAPDPENAAAVYPPWSAREQEIKLRFLDTPYLDRVLEESRAKHLEGEALRERLAAIRENWDGMREKIGEQLPGYEEVHGMLEHAGCMVVPEQLVLPRVQACSTLFKAQMIRNRYTVLDLAYETGQLVKLHKKLLESKRYLL